MLLNLAIIGIGISVGSIDSCEKLIDSFMNKSFKLNGERDKNSEKIALESALRNASAKAVTVITDEKISFEKNISEQLIENSFEEMLHRAKDFIDSDKSEIVTLVCHSADGCIALTLTENAEDRASKGIFMELTEDTSENKSGLSLFEIFLKAVTAAVEGELSLDLNDKKGKYLDYNDKKVIPLNNAALTVIKSRRHLKEKFRTQRYIIPVYFNSSDDAETKLERLKADILQNNIYDISLKYSDELKNRSANSYTIVFLVKSYEELERQINEVLEISDRLMTDNFRWSDKTGSFYIKNSIQKPEIVFMNPPGGMFKENIFYKFYSMLGGVQVCDGSQYFYLLENKNELLDRYLFEVAVTYITMILLESIGITPDHLSGASMGEITFITNDKIIKSKKDGSAEENLKFSMKGILDILCEVIDSQEKASEEYFGYKVKNWSKWYLKCNNEKVSAVVEKYSDVFTIIIGSPESVIISGENSSCTEIIAELGCIAIPLNDAFYIHTPILKSKSELIKRNIVSKKIYLDTSECGFELFSTYYRKKIDNTSEMLADDIVSVIVEKVDYASAISELYDKHDARIFIDLSTGKLAGTWAEETLKDRSESEIISIFDDSFSCEYLLDICAKLLSFNVSFDYGKLLSVFEFIKPSSKTAVQVCTEQRNVNINTGEKTNNSADFSAEMKQCVLRQIENNKKAYSIYLQSQNNLFRQAVLDLDKKEKISESKTSQNKGYLWGRDEIITMTDTSMSAILGDRYRQVDKYPVRARMPLPPFLFVSRIVSVDAEFGKLQPSQIVAEYDFDRDCVFRNSDNQMSQLVMYEASHIGIFLMGYIGIDAISDGTLSYRVLDSSQTSYSERPVCVGDTLRTVFRVNKFLQNGSTTIILYTYYSYLGDELVASCEGRGGFFTKSELMSNKGIINSSRLKVNVPQKEFIHFTSSEKRSYSEEELGHFYDGDYEQCFDAGTKISLKEKYYIPYNIHMIDRVTEIDYNGGMYKCGLICGEKNITPDLWPFKAHFKNDPVFPVVIIIEGVIQLEMILLAHAGFLGRYKNTNVVISKKRVLKSCFRGQVRKEKSLLKYEIHVKNIAEVEDSMYINFDVRIYNNDIQVIKIEDFELKIFDETSNN